MKYVLSTLLLFSCSLGFAQDNAAIKAAADKVKVVNADTDTTMGWKFNGFMSLNFSQTSLNNWAAGGKSAISSLGTVNINANYKKGKFRSYNTLNLNYGAIKQNDDPIQKNDDRIEVISNNGVEAAKNLYYTGIASFKTQFHATLNEEGVLVSNFMSPAWLQAALGINYTKDDRFSIVLAPLAGKFTFVNDQRLADSGSFGVEPAIIDPVSFAVLTPGKKIRSEIGAYVFISAKFDIMKNITLSTRMDLFNNYSDANKSNRKNIDVNWENNINMKINKFISASLFTHLIYDNDIDIEEPPKADGTIVKGPRTQFKQVFGLGISYKF